MELATGRPSTIAVKTQQCNSHNNNDNDDDDDDDDYDDDDDDDVMLLISQSDWLIYTLVSPHFDRCNDAYRCR